VWKGHPKLPNNPCLELAKPEPERKKKKKGKKKKEDRNKI